MSKRNHIDQLDLDLSIRSTSPKTADADHVVEKIRCSVVPFVSARALEVRRNAVRRINEAGIFDTNRSIENRAKSPEHSD